MVSQRIVDSTVDSIARRLWELMECESQYLVWSTSLPKVSGSMEEYYFDGIKALLDEGVIDIVYRKDKSRYIELRDGATND